MKPTRTNKVLLPLAKKATDWFAYPQGSPRNVLTAFPLHYLLFEDGSTLLRFEDVDAALLLEVG